MHDSYPDIPVSIASSVENAIHLQKSTTFDIIGSDYRMPETNGTGFDPVK